MQIQKQISPVCTLKTSEMQLTVGCVTLSCATLAFPWTVVFSSTAQPALGSSQVSWFCIWQSQNQMPLNWKVLFWPRLQAETRGNLKSTHPWLHTLWQCCSQECNRRAVIWLNMVFLYHSVLACWEALHWEFIKILSKGTAITTFTVTCRGMIQRQKLN